MILLQSFTWYVLKALSCCNGRADVALLLLVLLRSSEVACQGGSAGSLGLDTALCCDGVTSRWLIDSHCAVLHQASIVMNGDVTERDIAACCFHLIVAGWWQLQRDPRLSGIFLVCL